MAKWPERTWNMGLIEPVQKPRVPVAGKGELNFSEKAVVFRFGCGGELPVECFHSEEVDDQERINMRREEEGRFLEVDEFPSDVMEQDEHVEDVCQELKEQLDAIADRRMKLERQADKILAADQHSKMSTDAKPVLWADAIYLANRRQHLKLQHSVSQYAMAAMKPTGRFGLKAVPLNA